MWQEKETSGGKLEIAALSSERRQNGGEVFECVLENIRILVSCVEQTEETSQGGHTNTGRMRQTSPPGFHAPPLTAKLTIS